MTPPKSLWPVILVACAVLNGAQFVQHACSGDRSWLPLDLAFMVAAALWAWQSWSEE